LIHTISIVRLAETLDDAYGPAVSHEVPVYTDIAARITSFGGRYPDPDKQLDHGIDGKYLWNILTCPICEVARSDRIIMPYGNPANFECQLGTDDTPVASEIRYRILKIHHRVDECGRFHHTKLTVEQECDTTPADESANPIWA